jgi:hypothetical protein
MRLDVFVWVGYHKMRSHLKNAKSSHLYASCRPAESIFQKDGLEETPTCGRGFFTTIGRP